MSWDGVERRMMNFEPDPRWDASQEAVRALREHEEHMAMLGRQEDIHGGTSLPYREKTR